MQSNKFEEEFFQWAAYSGQELELVINKLTRTIDFSEAGIEFDTVKKYYIYRSK